MNKDGVLVRLCSARTQREFNFKTFNGQMMGKKAHQCDVGLG